jgi:hypothetical protein
MTRSFNKMMDWTHAQGKRGLRRRPQVAALAAGLAVFVACAVWGFGVSAARREALTGTLVVNPPVATSVPARAAVVVPQKDNPKDDTQVKLVTLTPRGFEPDEMLVTQKRFVLAIDNRSQLDDVFIQFSRITGNPAAPASKLQEMKMPRAKVNANSVFELPPGDYLLTEANHPNWVCKFTVSPK